MSNRSIYLFIMTLIACTSRPVKTVQSVQQEQNGVLVRATFINANGQGKAQNRSHNASAADEEYLLFNVQLERPGFEPDKKTVAYLDFEAQGDFGLVDGADTVMPVLVHRVANGRKGNFEYIVAFEKSTLQSSKEKVVSIVYSDKIFGLGRQIFSFRKQGIL